MWTLCTKDGSSLPLDWKLCGPIQSQIFHTIFIRFDSNLSFIQTGLAIIFLSITIDFFTGQPVVSQLSEIQQLLMYCSAVTSGLLGFAIGFLFSTQMYGLTKNVTTI